MGEEPAESLWLSISWQVNLSAVVVAGFCYRLSDQEEEVGDIVCRQLKEASLSWAVVFMVRIQPP